MDKNLLKVHINFDVAEKENGGECIYIWAIDALDMSEKELKENGLKGYKYAVFMPDYYYSTPVPAHFEPIPMELNSMIEESGLW